MFEKLLTYAHFSGHDKCISDL